MTIEVGVLKKDISLPNVEDLGARKKMDELPKKRKKDPFYELWKYANEYSLLGKMVEKRCLTNKEIETLRNLFEGKQIGRNERKFLRLLDKFGIAVAKLA